MDELIGGASVWVVADLIHTASYELSRLKHRDCAKSIGGALVVSLIFSFSDDKISSYVSAAANSKFSRSQETAADAEALKILECVTGTWAVRRSFSKA